MSTTSSSAATITAVSSMSRDEQDARIHKKMEKWTKVFKNVLPRYTEMARSTGRARVISHRYKKCDPNNSTDIVRRSSKDPKRIQIDFDRVVTREEPHAAYVKFKDEIARIAGNEFSVHITKSKRTYKDEKKENYKHLVITIKKKPEYQNLNEMMPMPAKKEKKRKGNNKRRSRSHHKRNKSSSEEFHHVNNKE